MRYVWVCVSVQSVSICTVPHGRRCDNLNPEVGSQLQGQSKVLST